MRRALVLACCALAIVTAPAAGDDAASGRRIFIQGGAKDDVAASFAGSNTQLTPRLRRCAGCHGADGHGGREGSVTVPPINWRALTTPRETSPAQPGRPAYDETALTRALGVGIDPTGRTLQGMPRYRLAPTQAASLIDYLRIVGTDADLDPGVTADEIRIGAVLPLSGPAAAQGRAIAAGLHGALAAAGPIYGRRVSLIAVDAGNDAASASRSLLAGDRVFALVGTMLPDNFGDIEADIPVIGPLRPTTTQVATNAFDLLAPLEDQMRVLVDALADEVAHPLRLIIAGPDGSLADAVADQAKRRGASAVQRLGASDLQGAATLFVDAIVVLPGADFGRIAADLRNQPGPWLLAGPAEALAPEAATDERLRLVFPIWPSDPSRLAATPPIAIAAAAVLIEGLKRMGARASRAGLIAAIETLRDIPTGVLPPLSFARGVHTGSFASVVIRPDRNRGMVMLGGWRTPR